MLTSKSSKHNVCDEPSNKNKQSILDVGVGGIIKHCPWFEPGARVGRVAAQAGEDNSLSTQNFTFSWRSSVTLLWASRFCFRFDKSVNMQTVYWFDVLNINSRCWFSNVSSKALDGLQAKWWVHLYNLS